LGGDLRLDPANTGSYDLERTVANPENNGLR
jgi:hypothetical protein